MFIVKYPEKGRFSLEGVLAEWKKTEGDTVNKGDVLFHIEAAGELLEMESSSDGILLKQVAQAGSFVKAGDPLAILGSKGDDASKVLEQLNIASEPTPSKQAPSDPSKPKTEQQTQKQTHKEETMASESAGNADNVIPILMPQAGQSMEEGTILSWKIKEGDTIEVGQVIMEIETDKATMEVEATDAGRVAKIVANEGDIVEVKKPVAYLAEEGVDISDATAAKPAPAKQTEKPAAKETKAPQKEEKKEQKSAPAKEKPAAPEKTAAPQGDVTPILMPQAGQSMEEGTILSWKVKEGDTIEVGQVIMEIETDKATMEVEAVDAGRIAKIVANEGDIVEIKQPVAYLAEEGVDVDAVAGGGEAPPAKQPEKQATPEQKKETKPEPAKEKQQTPVDESGRVSASPAARKAAKDKGIDLASIGSGSGPRGRIILEDVENADAVPTEAKSHSLSKMRKAIARNLSYSKQTIPHFYAKATIDATLLFSTYRKTKEQFKCSVNDFVTAGCAKAIRQYPAFRSQFKETEIIEQPALNIGIAVGTDEGLTVPVVLNADRMNLEQLAERTRQVVESARNGKLEGFGQGIFTISNLGMFGTEEFSAIINPPESAILAVGAIREGVIVENGAMRAGRLMTMTLSVDHRVIDGVVAAQFLKTLKELLEDPEQLI